MHKTLSIIGCGNLGKTLGHLWLRSGSFDLQDVLTRTNTSSKGATTFIGGGRAVARYADLRRADIYLIATPDADELNKGRRKMTLRFDLPRGSYATMLVKRVT